MLRGLPASKHVLLISDLLAHRKSLSDETIHCNSLSCKLFPQLIDNSGVLFLLIEVPRSADYEYEYVWVSRILTRWLSVPRRTYWQNEYEYEYNVVERVKLAAPGPLVRGLMCSRKKNRTTKLLIHRLWFSRSFFIMFHSTREFSRSLRQPLKKKTHLL